MKTKFLAKGIMLIQTKNSEFKTWTSTSQEGEEEKGWNKLESFSKVEKEGDIANHFYSSYQKFVSSKCIRLIDTLTKGTLFLK